MNKPALSAFLAVMAFSSLALAGSLTPPGSPASTMNTLEELFDSIAGTFDSSAIVSDQDGSLIQHLKYIEENMGGGVGSDSLDFDEFVDSMTLDDPTNIALNGFDFTFTGTGNMGIGTAAPFVKLQVEDNQPGLATIPFVLVNRASHSGDVVGMEFIGYRSNNTVNALADITAGWEDSTVGSVKSYLSFWTKGPTEATFIERMRIDGSGNVGIGTASPSFGKLVVQTSTGANARQAAFGDPMADGGLSFWRQRASYPCCGIFIADIATYADLGTASGSHTTAHPGGRIGFFTDASWSGTGTVPTAIRFMTGTSGASAINERFRITSTGNIGINTPLHPTLGTNTTDAQFEIRGSTSFTTATIASISGTSLTTGSALTIRVPTTATFSGGIFRAADTAGRTLASISAGGSLELAGYASISGVLRANGGCIGCGAVTSDSLDFDEFVDAMTLDANTRIASAGFTLGILGDVAIGSGSQGPIGAAKLEIYGPSTSVANGPHLQIRTNEDQYPLLQALGWSHDNIGLRFDSYFDGAERSSDVGSNYIIYKVADQLRFLYSSGNTPGSVAAYTIGMSLNAQGLTQIQNLSLTSGFSGTAWGLSGAQFRANSSTFTDTSTLAAGTATNAVIASFARPTIAATNAGVTTTNAATVYIANSPLAGTNQAITNPYAFWIDDGTARFDGEILLSTAFPGQNALKFSTQTFSATTPGGFSATVPRYGTTYIASSSEGSFSAIHSAYGGFRFYTGNTNLVADRLAMVITNAGISPDTGNVGIGTANVSQRLEVAGTASISGVLFANGGCVGCGGVASDGLDFDEFRDAMTLDATTSIASAGFNLDVGSTWLYAKGNPFIHRSGASNSFMGEHAGEDITTGFWNAVVGAGAGVNLNTGAANVYMGYLAGNVSTSSNNNVFIGANAGQNNTSGGTNVFIGRQAGLVNTTGSENTFVGGFNPGSANTTGGLNTFIGTRAGAANTTGGNNTFLGYRAGGSNTTATDNTFVGLFAGLTNSTGQWSTYIGRDAGRLALGSFNTFLGGGADATTTNATGAIAIGYLAKVTASNQLVVGSGAASGSITDAYLGQGVTAVSPAGITLNATGGSGTNNAGAPLRIAGGRGTGSAAGGNLVFQVAPAGGSGSSLNALVDRMTLWGDHAGASLSGNFGPTSDSTFDLGSSALRWRDLYLASGSLHIGVSGDEAVIDYHVNDDYLSFKPDGSTTGFVMTDAGNFGIGTTTPQATLAVDGTASISGNVNVRGTLFVQPEATGAEDQYAEQFLRTWDDDVYSVLDITNLDSFPGGGNDKQIDIYAYGSAYGGTSFGLSNSNKISIEAYAQSVFTIGTLTAHPLILGTDNAERLRIDAAGNVGIGTTTPAAKLDVFGAGNSLRLSYDADNYGEMYTDAGGTFFIDSVRTVGPTQPWNVVLASSGGNVGIGTAIPTSKLHVGQTNTAANTDITTGQVTLTDTGNLTTVSATKEALSATLNASGTYQVGGELFTLSALNGEVTYSGTIGSGGDGDDVQIAGVNALATFSGASGDVQDTIAVYGIRAQSGGAISTSASTLHVGGSFAALGTAGNNYGISVSATGATDTNYGVQVGVTGAADTNYGLSVSAIGATNNYGIEITGPSVAAGNYALYSGATAQSYFAGNVGIGGDAPEVELEVVGTASISQALTVGNHDFSGASYDLAVGNDMTDPATRTVVDINPAWTQNTNTGGFLQAFNTDLSVDGTGDINGGIIGMFVGPYYTGSGDVARLDGIDASAYFDGPGTVASLVALRTDGGIGASSGTILSMSGIQVTPNDNATGTVNNNYGILIENQTAGTLDWNLYSSGSANNYFGGRLGIGTTAPTQELHISSASDGDLLRLVDSDGDCTVNPEAVTTFSCSSDRRLKDDIEDTQPILARIMDFRVRDFTMRSSGDPQTGVIAQEVQETWPDMVSMGASGYLKVEQPNPWLVIKAIQELNGKIEDLGTQGPLHLDQPSLTEEFFAAIIAKFKELLGIEFEQGKVKANRLCAGDVCVDEEQLGELLELTGGLPEEEPTPETTPEPTDSPEVTPVDEEEVPPTPEPESEPEPESDPEQESPDEQVVDSDASPAE